MENVLVQKPAGAIKKWVVAGIIVALLYYISYILTNIYYSEIMFMQYQVQASFIEYLGIFLSINGLFITSAFVFFIGLFVSKNRNFFIKFMLWTMLLLDLYMIMPQLGGLVQVFVSFATGSLDGLKLIYSLGLLLPHVFVAILLVSAIIQKDSENNSITNKIAWISIVVDVVLLVFQFIYVFSLQQLDVFSIGASLSSAFIIGVLICLSFIILMATKSNAPAKKANEEILDELVEKIAHEDSKDHEPDLENLVEKISHEDE